MYTSMTRGSQSAMANMASYKKKTVNLSVLMDMHKWIGEQRGSVCMLKLSCTAHWIWVVKRCLNDNYDSVK